MRARLPSLPLLLAALALCGCASLDEAYRRPPDPPPLAETVRHAEKMLAAGERARAVAALEQAIAAQSPDTRDQAATAALALLGRAYLQSADLDRARPLLDRAIVQGRTLGADALIAAALNDQGLVELASGHEAAAIAAFEASIARADAAGQPAMAARAALSLADAQRRGGDSAASRPLALAIALARTLPPGAEKSLLLSAAAHRMRPGMLDLREAVLHEALDAAIDARARSQALGLMGEAEFEAGRLPRAVERTQSAIFAAQAAQAPDLLFRWEWQAARLATASGEAENALAHYRRAHASLATVRHDLLADLKIRRESYRDAIGPAFLEFADLLLRAAEGAGGGQAERERLLEAREVIEQMKTVELEDYFQDECVARFRAQARPLESLAAGTAVIYPVILPGRLELLVSSGAEIERVSVAVPAATLAEEARGLRRALEKRTTHEYLPLARRLHARLIDPLLPFLARHQVDTLVIVPDAALRAMPFAALNDGSSFLVERYAIATAPALSLVEASQAHALAGRHALLGGLSESVQQHPALPQVARELDDVSRLFDSRVLGNVEFELPAFAKAMGAATYSVVHIASHGQFDSDPRKTYLLTWDGRIGMDQLEGLMRSGRGREEPVELLTLSACRTAAGDDRAALGLAGVAVKAGALSALATLWYINDEASSLLVTDFYREMAAGQPTKAKALQQAQRHLLADARYRHPGYWAPFLLIGNWL